MEALRGAGFAGAATEVEHLRRLVGEIAREGPPDDGVAGGGVAEDAFDRGFGEDAAAADVAARVQQVGRRLPRGGVGVDDDVDPALRP